MTDSERLSAMHLEQFSALADAFGGDIERWPVAARPAAVRLLASSPSARAILKAAQALDRLLDNAQAAAGTVGADLFDRVVVAATGQSPAAPDGGSPAKRSATVLPWPSREPDLVHSATAPRARPTTRNWPFAAALAASLALGITIGAHDLTHAPVRGLIEIASVETDVDQFIAALHEDGLAIAVDEEHL